MTVRSQVASAARPAEAGPDLTQAVRGGLRSQRLRTALHEAFVAGSQPAAPLPSPPPEPPPPRSGIRAWVRRGLRLLRPLASPFLHRFEWRVRTAVEKTDFAATTRQQLRELAERGAEVHVQLARQAEATLELDRRLQHEYAARLNELATETIRQVTAAQRDAEDRLTARLNDLTVVARRAAAVPLANNEYLVRTDAGWLLVPGEDERLLMAMVETGGALEPGTLAVLRAVLRPGDRMIDVGAHIGTMTVPAARAVGPAGRVIAIEPGARAAGLLRRSLHVNSLAEYVTLHDCAAGAAAGEALLHVAPVIGENSLVFHPDDAGETVPVTVRPLDDLVPSGPVRLVKIDAEGYEGEVWRGMRRIVADNAALAVIVEFGPEHLARAGIAIADWFARFREDGFMAWEIDAVSGTLRALRPETEQAAIFSVNLLMSREPPARLGLRVA